MPAVIFPDTLRFVIAFGLVLTLGACRAVPAEATPAPPSGETSAPGAPLASPTSFLPPSPATVEAASPTPEPLALLVNGEGVTLDDFNAALQRFHAGVPEASSAEAVQRVADDFIAQVLLAQGAAQAGFVLDEAALAERIAGLTAQAGGEQAMAGWLAANFYTPERFARELRRALMAAWMRDQIAAGVPLTAEQVRARQVRASTREQAEAALAQLAGGMSFDLLAEIYDPVGLGELGWFPRGYLLEPAIEAAAFELQEGAYSGVIETGVGFHIIQVMERAADRPLEPDALWALQLRALDEWLAARRAAGEVQVLVTPGADGG
jgi:peptidyl-prolyl cis-trans isomerase C